MTDVTLFGQHLFTLGTGVATWLVLLLGSALTAGAGWLRQRLLMGVDDHGRLVGARVGNVMGLLGAAGALAGLRLVETTVGVQLGGGEQLVQYLAVGSQVMAAGVGVSAVMAGITGHALGQPRLLGSGGSATAPALEAAARNVDGLWGTVQALETSRQQARQLTQGAPSADLREEHQETQAAVEVHLNHARALATTAAQAVVRAHCAGLVDAVMRVRPDVPALARGGAVTSSQVARAVAQLDAFLSRAGTAADQLRAEQDAAPGSMAQRVHVSGVELVTPHAQALEEVMAAYARVRQRLLTLELRLRAREGGAAAVALAQGVAAAAPPTGDDAAGLAGEVTAAEHATQRVLQLASPDVGALDRAVEQARKALAQPSEPALGEVLRTIRQLSSGDDAP